MFTGIIEETGKISKIDRIASGKQFTITARRVLTDLKAEDSISVSGVCLTVVSCNSSTFQAIAVQETLNSSILGRIRPGTEVNLERAMSTQSRFGGHFVYGHVDGTGIIHSVIDQGKNRLIEVEIPVHLEKYMIHKGSVALDGISLTIADIRNKAIMISIIPYTLQNTTFVHIKKGDRVNIEVDILGKYIEKFMNSKEYNANNKAKFIDFLQ